MKFSSNPKALGICDRCGLTFKLNTLQNQVINRRRSGVMVCESCLDIDQEQLQVGKRPVDDAIALRNPRPDTDPGR